MHGVIRDGLNDTFEIVVCGVRSTTHYFLVLQLVHRKLQVLDHVIVPDSLLCHLLVAAYMLDDFEMAD